jgi:hypothetical protein
MLALVGVFAAMARNAYGFDFIGTACLGLSLLFLLQLVWKVANEYGALHRGDVPEMAELILLSLFTLMFGLRAFYIYVNNGGIILAFIIVFQVPVYLTLGYFAWTDTKKENPLLANNILSLYASVFIFLLSLLIQTNTLWFMSMGSLATVMAAPFIISVIRKRPFELKSKTTTLLQFVIASKNKTGLLFLFFISSALFTGLGYFNVIPTIENVERPKDYIDLINNAESGKEKPVDGEFQHQKYKEAMDKFLERHGKKK